MGYPTTHLYFLGIYTGFSFLHHAIENAVVNRINEENDGEAKLGVIRLIILAF